MYNYTRTYTTNMDSAGQFATFSQASHLTALPVTTAQLEAISPHFCAAWLDNPCARVCTEQMLVPPSRALPRLI